MTAACLASGVAAAAGAGAMLMYYFDPDRGKARRTVVRDKTTSTVRHGGKVVEGFYADLSNRAHGLKAELDNRLHPKPVDDSKLVARLRSKLGRVSTHPHAIGVACTDGKVILNGHVLVDEVDRILFSVRLVPGVKAIENRMAMHESAVGVPELGGSIPKPAEDFVMA
ncbi:MAG: BON domain-containing protein [Bryobacteraceae bacterium]